MIVDVEIFGRDVGAVDVGRMGSSGISCLQLATLLFDGDEQGCPGDHWGLVLVTKSGAERSTTRGGRVSPRRWYELGGVSIIKWVDTEEFETVKECSQKRDEIQKELNSIRFTA